MRRSCTVLVAGAILLGLLLQFQASSYNRSFTDLLHFNEKLLYFPEADLGSFAPPPLSTGEWPSLRPETLNFETHNNGELWDMVTCSPLSAHDLNTTTSDNKSGSSREKQEDVHDDDDDNDDEDRDRLGSVDVDNGPPPPSSCSLSDVRGVMGNRSLRWRWGAATRPAMIRIVKRFRILQKDEIEAFHGDYDDTQVLSFFILHNAHVCDINININNDDDDNEDKDDDDNEDKDDDDNMHDNDNDDDNKETGEHPDDRYDELEVRLIFENGARFNWPLVMNFEGQWRWVGLSFRLGVKPRPTSDLIAIEFRHRRRGGGECRRGELYFDFFMLSMGRDLAVWSDHVAPSTGRKVPEIDLFKNVNDLLRDPLAALIGRRYRTTAAADAEKKRPPPDEEKRTSYRYRHPRQHRNPQTSKHNIDRYDLQKVSRRPSAHIGNGRSSGGVAEVMALKDEVRRMWRVLTSADLQQQLDGDDEVLTTSSDDAVQYPPALRVTNADVERVRENYMKYISPPLTEMDSPEDALAEFKALEIREVISGNDDDDDNNHYGRDDDNDDDGGVWGARGRWSSSSGGVGNAIEQKLSGISTEGRRQTVEVRGRPLFTLKQRLLFNAPHMDPEDRLLLDRAVDFETYARMVLKIAQHAQNAKARIRHHHDQRRRQNGPANLHQDHHHHQERQNPLHNNDDDDDNGDDFRSIANGDDGSSRRAVEELTNAYILMTRHLLTQGFAYGASRIDGRVWGYFGEWWYISVVFMQDELRAAGLFKQVLDALVWLMRESPPLEMAITPECGDLDYFNTLSGPHLALLLVQNNDNDAEDGNGGGQNRLKALRAFSNFFSTAILYPPTSLNDGFKPDGSGWHHRGHYAGYSLPAMQGAAKIARILHGTSLKLAHEARVRLRRQLLMAWVSSNLEVPMALGGRHPFYEFSMLDFGGAYRDLALSFVPIDSYLASVYLKLYEQFPEHPNHHSSPNDVLALFHKPIQPAILPTGSWALNGAATLIHRVGDRVAIVKGYNQEVFSAEIYKADNRYGRYQSHGSIQVMPWGTRSGYGMMEDGWDWNSNPGATVVRVPLHVLNSPVGGSAATFSEVGVCGAVSLRERYGFFSMWNIEPRGIRNFDTSFKFQKFVLAVDGLLYVIGRGITSRDRRHSVTSGLWQREISDGHTGIVINDGTLIKETRWTNSATSGDWLIDDNSVGYYLIDVPVVHMVRGDQFSRHSETKSVTKGTFSTAWIDHGHGPSDARFEYIVALQGDRRVMANIAKQAIGDEPRFRIIEHSDTGIAVHDSKNRLYGFGTSASGMKITEGPVRRVSGEGNLLLQEGYSNGGMVLSIASARLGLEKGTRTRRVPVEVQLAGRWKNALGPNRKLSDDRPRAEGGLPFFTHEDEDTITGIEGEVADAQTPRVLVSANCKEQRTIVLAHIYFGMPQTVVLMPIDDDC